MKTIYLGVIMTEDHTNVVSVLEYETKHERNIAWKAIDATWSLDNPYNYYMWFVDVTINDKNECTSIIEYTHLEPVAYLSIKKTLNKLGIK